LGKAITERIHELNGVINHLFKISVLSHKEWKAMFFLHALRDDGEFEMMWEMLETLLATGSLTSQKIIECLEQEAQRLKGQTKEKAAQEMTFMACDSYLRPNANLKPKVSGASCSNCEFTNHVFAKCYRPGGPLHVSKQKESESSEEKDAKRKEKNEQERRGRKRRRRRSTKRQTQHAKAVPASQMNPAMRWQLS
jgi:hypothetical protein